MGRFSAFLCVTALLVIYVVASTGLVGVVSSSSTFISSCTDIHDPGYYTLASDLNGFQYGVDYCIQISGSDIVLDGGGHSLVGNLTSWSGVGIKVVSSSRVVIKNVKIAGYNQGVYLYYSSGSGLEGVTVSNSNYGVYIDYSNNNTVVDAVLRDNGAGGVFMTGSRNNTVENVLVSNSFGGVLLYYSHNNTVRDGVFVNNGLVVYDSYDNVVENVTVNGKNLIYLENEESVVIDESSNAGQVVLVRSENVTLRNLVIGNATTGVILWASSRNRLENVTVMNNTLGTGVSLFNSNDNEIRYLTSINNTYGAYISDSRNNTIANSSLSNNRYTGLTISYSGGNKVVNTTANYNNFYGILLYSTYGNTLEGVVAVGNKEGMSLTDSSGNKVGNSVLSGNEYYGIMLLISSNNTIVGNVIRDNAAYGVRLDSSDNNIFYNNLLNNKGNILISRGGVNYWNTTKTPGKNIVGGDFIGGNYWGNPAGTGFSDTCVDSDNDGICDEALIIDSSNVDYLPLKKAQIPPDLTISISYSPAQPVVNQQITLTAIVENVGGGVAGAFNVSVHAGNSLIGEARVGELGVNETKELIFNWTPTLPGSYVLEAFADSSNEILEANETNNKVYASINVTSEQTITPTTTPTTTPTPTTTTPTSTPVTTPTTTPTTTPATTSQTATLTSPVPADNTLLYTGIVIAIIIISGVLVSIMTRKKK